MGPHLPGRRELQVLSRSGRKHSKGPLRVQRAFCIGGNDVVARYRDAVVGYQGSVFSLAGVLSRNNLLALTLVLVVGLLQRRTLPGKLCPDHPTGRDHFGSCFGFGLGSCFCFCPALALALALALAFDSALALVIPFSRLRGKVPGGRMGELWLGLNVGLQPRTPSPQPLSRERERGLSHSQSHGKNRSRSQRKGGDAISACMKEGNGDSAATCAVHRVSSQYQFASFQSTGHWTRQRQGLPLSGRQRMPHRIP